MTTHIPTIQDLDSKTVRELLAIFQHAADVSANAQRSDAERAAARQTLANIRCVFVARHPQP